MSFQQFSPLNDAQNEKPSSSYNEMAGDPRNQLRDQESESVPVRRQSIENHSFHHVDVETNSSKSTASFLRPISSPNIPDSPPIAALSSTCSSSNLSDCAKESRSGSKGSSGVFCRICHDGDLDGDKLISPCSCSGSVGLIHRQEYI